MPGVEHTERRRHYSAPPVVEAIARVTWASASPWTVTAPGALFAALRDEYPSEPETRNQIEAAIPGSDDAQASFQFRTGPNELVFSNLDRSRLLIVGPTSVSVHGLPPYEGWETLENRLSSAISIVQRALGWESAVQTLSIRYINRVEIPEPSITISDFLTIDFALPPSFPTRMGGFLDRVDVYFDDAPVKLSFTFASTDAEAGRSAFILDLDLTHSLPEPMAWDEAKPLMTELKSKETAAFEGLLRDAAREVFDELS